MHRRQIIDTGKSLDDHMEPWNETGVDVPTNPLIYR